MKKITTLFLSAAFIMSAMLTSCGKYEDGPGLSLRSKKARLCQTWKPEKYIDGQTGTEVAAGANDGKIAFEKDGKFKMINGSVTTEGTWAWANDKEGIAITFSAGGFSSTTTSTILRLTMKEFWTKDTDGDKTYFTAE
ncbi:MAG: hypothetical protein ACK40M_03565 [Flavobacteriales bacterium]